jgi:prolyl oligopeptidase
MKLRRFPIGTAILVVCVVFAGCENSPAPPVVTPTGVPPVALARTDSHVDTLQGVTVPDPYRWLEDTLSPEVREWVTQQQTYASQILSRVVHRDSLAAMYEQAFRDAPTLDDVIETPEGFVLKRWLDDSPTIHSLRRDLTGEQPLLAVDARADLSQTNMRTLVPSNDGRFLAIGTTAGGDEGAAIAVVDVSTGKLLPDRIDDLLTTTSDTRYQVTWLPETDRNEHAFFYPRVWPGSASGPPAERLARSRQFLHRIGTARTSDIPVFGFGVSPAVPMAPEDLATRVRTAPKSRWLLASVFRARQNGSEHYAARRTPGDTSVPSWTPLATLEDRAGYPQLRGDTAWVLARRNADRGHILRRVLGNGPLPQGPWEVAVAEREGVITSFSVQNDAVYFIERNASGMYLQTLAHGGTVPRTVMLPVTGTIRIAPRPSQMDGVLVSIESWATAPKWFRVLDAGGVVEAIAISDGSKAVPSSTLVSEQIQARSRDGTMVPVSLVYDTKAMVSNRLDGTAPLLIETYGGFSSITDPRYDPYAQVWCALGGVYAYAHVRGGGELGDAWHRSAMRENKQRTMDDVIGAVETLIARGYTSAGRVAIQGISFGAMVSGLVPLQRPELFGVAVYDVGGPDEIRATALDPSAARNVAEIGDMDTPEGIEMLRKVSPYHMVPLKIPLPAVLLHSASDDYNFGTEMLVAKYVARLQAANAGTRPVVWVRETGGHRWLASLSPKWAATVASFLLWQTGDVRFQPKDAAAPPR